jgi:hypothetical protein
MPERVQTGERGVYRIRAVFFSDRSRLETMADSAVAEQLVRQRRRVSVQQQNAATFLIADCRLADASNPVLGLLPAQLRVRLTSSLQEGARGNDSPEVRPRKRWQAVLPWVAAIVTAGAGFWVFLHRTL